MGDIGPTPVNCLYTLGLPDPDGVIRSSAAKQIVEYITFAQIHNCRDDEKKMTN